MFKNKFGNLINNFKSLDFFSDLKIFKESLYKNLDEFVKNLWIWTKTLTLTSILNFSVQNVKLSFF